MYERCGETGRTVVIQRREDTGKGRGTPRLLAPVGTPGETGDWRPDGRKPEAGEGAGPGSGWCNRNSGRKEWKERKTVDM